MSTVEATDDRRGSGDGGHRGRRSRPLLAAIAVFAVGFLIVLVALIGALAARGPANIEGNAVTPAQYVVWAPGGRWACQAANPVPAEAGRLRVTAAVIVSRRVPRALPTPPLELRLRAGARTIATGLARAGWRQGVVDIPLRSVARPSPGGELCLRVRGRGTLAVAGELRPPEQSANVGGRPAAGNMSLLWLERTEPTRFDELGSIQDHLDAFSPSPFGGLALVLVALGALGLWALAGWLLLGARWRR